MSSQGADPDRSRSRAKLRTKSRSLHQKNSSGPVSILAEASVGNLEIGAEKGHPLEFYDVLDTLGTGGFAVVKRVRDKKTLEAFAMKVINVAMLENPDENKTDDERAKEIMTIREVMSEIQTLRKLNHPSILNLKEYCVTEAENHVYVITEVLYGGAVLDAILKMKDERYTEAEAKVVVRRTLEGIDYMHSHLVIHRDLKLENLLLKQQDDLASVVIADFGLAKRCREKTTSSKKVVSSDGEYLPHAKGVDDSAVGTPVYAAPEVVEQKSYGAAVDMWSLGVITYILVTGAMPRDL